MISIPTTGEARKIGDALIFVELDEDHPDVQMSRRAWYKGAVIAEGEIWPFSDIGSPIGWDLAWDSNTAYDEMASAAISFGSNDKWSDVADSIRSATEWAQDENGVYEVERINEYLENPASFTAKGERMYENILRGYLDKGVKHPEAKRIAAATVYARSATVPGLVKSRYQRNPEEGGFTMANPKLSSIKRKRLKPREFAVPELKKLPIEDSNHIRNAMARFNQVKGLSKAQKERAYNRIVDAAVRHGIDASNFMERYAHYA